MPMTKGAVDHPEVLPTEVTVGEFPYRQDGEHWVRKDNSEVVADPISLADFVKRAAETQNSKK